MHQRSCWVPASRCHRESIHEGADVDTTRRTRHAVWRKVTDAGALDDSLAHRAGAGGVRVVMSTRESVTASCGGLRPLQPEVTSNSATSSARLPSITRPCLAALVAKDERQIWAADASGSPQPVRCRTIFTRRQADASSRLAQVRINPDHRGSFRVLLSRAAELTELSRRCRVCRSGIRASCGAIRDYRSHTGPALVIALIEPAGRRMGESRPTHPLACGRPSLGGAPDRPCRLRNRKRTGHVGGRHGGQSESMPGRLPMRGPPRRPAPAASDR